MLVIKAVKKKQNKKNPHSHNSVIKSKDVLWKKSVKAVEATFEKKQYLHFLRCLLQPTAIYNNAIVWLYTTTHDDFFFFNTTGRDIATVMRKTHFSYL